MKIKSFIVFIAIVVSATACVESEVCSTETTAFLNFELLDSSNDEVPDSVLNYINIRGLGSDSVFFGKYNSKEAYLLLNPYTDTASYFVFMSDLDTVNIYDTIELHAALDSNYTIYDTVLFAADTTVRYLSDIDSSYTDYFDTLTLYYDRTNSYLNDACGFTFEFKLKDIAHTTNNIDSIKINFKPVLLDASENHLSVYIHIPGM